MRPEISLLGRTLWWAYRSATTAAYLILRPTMLLMGALGAVSRREWRERLGFLPADFPQRAVWLHAASVGEVAALGPLIRAIRRRRPKAVMIVSTMTETGRRRAEAAFGLRAVIAPLDAMQCVRRWLARANPRVLLIMETELWPIWLSATARQAPVAWINGRISDRAFPRYRMIKSLLRFLFSRMRALCVIGKRDAWRVRQLGASARTIHVMGNVKADLVPKRSGSQRPHRRLWLVAGSTRTGEDEIILAAFERLSDAFPQARLCIAPRHLERAHSLERLVRKMGFSCRLRSEAREGKAKVLILDTHGELSNFYGKALAAFVGGTLVPIGGHNVLEPASMGKPVCFGRYTANVRDQADGLVKRGGGFRVNSASSLAAHWERCIRAPAFALAAGRRAREFAESQSGASIKIVALLLREGLI